MNVEYKGYRLQPVAKRTSSGKWAGEIVIEHPAQDDAEDFDFQCRDLFATAREAEEASITLGKQIIDGKHPDMRIE